MYLNDLISEISLSLLYLTETYDVFKLMLSDSSLLNK